MTKHPSFRAAIILSALAGTVLSGAIHESGHALVAASQGLQVTHIQPFWFLGSPHTSMSGNMTPHIMAATDLGGILGVVIVSILGMYMVPFHLLERKAAAVLAVIFPALFGQLIAWIILPLVMLFGGKIKDDVANFINHSGIHPLWVSSLSGILLTFCLAVFFARTHFLATVREIKKRETQYVQLPFSH